MAELSYFTGPMDCGKSTLALQLDYTQAAETPLPETGVEIRNMRTETAEQVVESLLDGQEETA